MWLDADALITNLRLPLDRIVNHVIQNAASTINHNENIGLIVSTEAEGINAGSFLLANSPSGRAIVQAWAAGATASTIKSDQTYLKSLFDSNQLLKPQYWPPSEKQQDHVNDDQDSTISYALAPPCALMTGGGLEWSEQYKRPYWEGFHARGDFCVHFWGRPDKLKQLRIVHKGSLGLLS